MYYHSLSTLSNPFCRRKASLHLNRGSVVWSPFIASFLYTSAALAKNPLPVRPTVQPSHLTDWILLAVAVVIIFAILHYLHRNRLKSTRKG